MLLTKNYAVWRAHHCHLRFLFDPEEDPLVPVGFNLDLFWTAPGRTPFLTKGHIDVGLLSDHMLCGCDLLIIRAANLTDHGSETCDLPTVTPCNSRA